MPLFVMIGRDGAGDGSLRQENRPAHLEYWNAKAAENRVTFAGPLLDEPGGKAVGSLIIFEAADLIDAHEMASLDPYARACVFGTVEIKPLKQVLPED